MHGSPTLGSETAVTAVRRIWPTYAEELGQRGKAMTRTFEQLTKAEQAKAVEIALTDLVGAVIEGSIRFNDTLNADDLQGRIDAAMGKADAMQNPWFATEYLRGDAYVWTMLAGMAQVSAEDAEYRTADDPYVVTL